MGRSVAADAGNADAKELKALLKSRKKESEITSAVVSNYGKEVTMQFTKEECTEVANVLRENPVYLDISMQCREAGSFNFGFMGEQKKEIRIGYDGDFLMRDLTLKTVRWKRFENAEELVAKADAMMHTLMRKKKGFVKMNLEVNIAVPDLGITCEGFHGNVGPSQILPGYLAFLLQTMNKIEKVQLPTDNYAMSQYSGAYGEFAVYAILENDKLVQSVYLKDGCNYYLWLKDFRPLWRTNNICLEVFKNGESKGRFKTKEEVAEQLSINESS